ncbi:hypothetical protein ACOMHN_024488 [Nucella lapillus]
MAGRSVTGTTQSSRSNGASRRLSRAITKQLAGFVGVGESEARAVKWENRRKHFAHTMGNLKPQYTDQKFVDNDGASHSRTTLPIAYQRKQSVAAMTFHGISNAIVSLSFSDGRHG